ncbi:MAG: hypothetical protein RLZZ584_3063 [Pseudomonadota bacterium]|jgi:mxaK protein
MSAGWRTSAGAQPGTPAAGQGAGAGSGAGAGAGSAGLPGLVRLTTRDLAWLRWSRRLRLLVQLGVLACLGVAGQAAWQLHQALHWNQRLLALAAEPVPDAAALREAARVAAEQAARAASRNAARQETHPAPVWQDEVASAAGAAASAASAVAAAEQQVPAWLADGSPPAWRFAQALQLARAGDLDAALARYRSVHDDPQLGNAARYNSANTLLREALQLAGTAAPGQALVMFELAKEGYRSVLRRDPQFWAARYNLERALTLQPDGEVVESASAERGERAATTMRSVSRGLP